MYWGYDMGKNHKNHCIARDMNLTLPKPQKSSLLINTFIISVAMLLRMQSKANGA
jgi:hypothetical protein